MFDKDIIAHFESNMSKAERLATAPKHVRDAFFGDLTPEELKRLEASWEFWARPNQLAPGKTDEGCETPGCDCGGNWIYWLILAGRGWGKTRTGAEWVHEGANSGKYGRFHLIGATASDARDVMVEGESGIMATQKPENPCVYKSTRRLIEWNNGARALLFSADEPERLRGPQAEAAWADELAAWRYEMAWEQLQLGMRLGPMPRTIITTTPRPTKLIKRLVKDKLTHITKGATFDNVSNLSTAFINEITAKYEGTRFGRQEIYAEILDESELALWSRDNLDEFRVGKDEVERTRYDRIVVAIDPAVSYGENSDETGIIVAGRAAANGHAYVLEDLSGKYRPEEWARKAVSAYHRHQASGIVAEKNQGYDMVEHTILVQDPNVPVKLVHASKAKLTRAEPVATAYERGRVHHVGSFPELEDQLVEWEAGSPNSPDRLDALVWAITDLLIGRTVVAIAPMIGNELGKEKESYWRGL